MRRSDVLELLTLAAMWGGSFLFMRVTAPPFGPVALIALRVVPALGHSILCPLALAASISRRTVGYQARRAPPLSTAGLRLVRPWARGRRATPPGRGNRSAELIG